MPIHDYRCPVCNCIEEKLTGAYEEDKHCPKCGTEMVRQFSMPAWRVLNRQKPCGFQWHPEELNADKDQWAYWKDKMPGALPPHLKSEYYSTYHRLKNKVAH